MTLTELRYVVAVARERHFGRAAQACHASQPTLSVAIRKFEEELGVRLFERGASEVTPTAIGERVIAQAQHVLEQAGALREIARQGRDPLSGPLRLAAIYTVGPYLLPALVRQLQRDVPRMPLLLSENFTSRLLELLRNGEIDAAVLALPLPEAGLSVQPLYDEPFVLAVPREHAWARRKTVGVEELAGQTTLLLGAGHCFRDQVLHACPDLERTTAVDEDRKTIEGSSLETIRQMVASGIGVAVLPCTSVPERVRRDSLIGYIAFRRPVPNRRVVLAWRKSFTRAPAIAAVCAAVHRCNLSGARKIEPVARGA
ncbi:MAG TPA: LysR substrate-binding domain-containing protein [Burkholderiaceae bacterium]|nr:LysR substrate-binding domain-containing protein [Burkholderiaceae bacterium]